MMHRSHYNYSLALVTPSPRPATRSNRIHSSTTPANLTTSSSVFDACKHTLTRASAFATVGYEMGRTRYPFEMRYADRRRGSSVRRGMMGVVSGCEVDGGDGIVGRETGYDVGVKNVDSCRISSDERA